MERPRAPQRTRKRIFEAARKEFAAKGFAGARMEGIARRAGVSKQLILHHFKSKESLYSEIHDVLSRPSFQSLELDDYLQSRRYDLIADRFHKRVKNLDYVRLLTWEAAGIRNRALPNEEERKGHIAQRGEAIRLLQAAGRLPKEMNYRMLQLAIVSLASYPLSFSEITRLITGYRSTDPKFQRQWSKFLRQLGKLLTVSAKDNGRPPS